MKEINDLIRKNDIKPIGYKRYDKVTIINTKEDRLVIKEKTNDIYEYLNSRGFNYYPKLLKEEDKYQIFEYIDGINMPEEQKILDMISLVSILHNKTTYYKNVDSDTYKQIYEDINNNIEHLRNYYSDLITLIENKVYPSPSELVLENNISKIFACLNYSKGELDKWLELVKNKTKQRYVLLHNNLSLDHYIRNENSYLISWNKAKIDIPIFDLYKLYKKYALNFDFESILKRYEKTYPLLEEEKKLLFILITLPNKIEFNQTEYDNTLLVTNMIETIYKTEKLLEEYSKTKKEYTTNK